MNPPDDDHLREMLRQGFGSRPTLRLAEAAKLLKINQKLLRYFARRNIVPCRITGSGRRRLRREFTVSDLIVFYRTATGRPAGSMPARTRPRARKKPIWTAKGGFLALAERRRRRLPAVFTGRGHGRDPSSVGGPNATEGDDVV
jgi:hypothetical protein